VVAQLAERGVGFKSLAEQIDTTTPSGKLIFHAEAKLWHGLRRFRQRGLENVNIEGLLIAAGQKLKRFLSATGWGRRHAPCVGACSSADGPTAPLSRLRATISSSGTSVDLGG